MLAAIKFPRATSSLVQRANLRFLAQVAGTTTKTKVKPLKFRMGTLGHVAEVSPTLDMPWSAVSTELSREAAQQLKLSTGINFDGLAPGVLLLPLSETKWIGVWNQDHGTPHHAQALDRALKPAVRIGQVFGDTPGAGDEIVISDLESILPLLKSAGYDDKIICGWDPRMRRWDWLSTVLPTPMQTHVEEAALLSPSMSSARWKMIDPVYETAITPYTEATSDVSADIVTKLAAILSDWKRGNDNLETDDRSGVFKDMVTLLLPDQVVLDAEESLDGQQLKCQGCVDFAIRRGHPDESISSLTPRHALQRIGVVQMKTSGMVQGKTEALLGCEIVRDLDELTEAIGIVSTLDKWTLMRVQDEQVLLEEGLQVDFDENGNANKESVKILAGKLTSLLTETTQASPL